jgi:Glycosyl hydrolase family 67 N-terminus
MGQTLAQHVGIDTSDLLFARVFDGADIGMTVTRFVSTVLRCALFGASFFCATAFPSLIDAETGAEAWLRCSALDPRTARSYERFPAKTVILGDALVLKTAQRELVHGVAQMLAETLRAGVALPPENAIVLGTLTELHVLAPALHPLRN